MKVSCRVLRVEPEKLSHLDEGQRAELVAVLDEFAACFSDKPGLCDVVTHRIGTTPDFVPEQMRPYRVPIVFQADVNRQMREPSDKGLARPSVSPMARALFRSTTRAIVFVAKKSGGVRIAWNFRYWNILAVGDAHSTSKDRPGDSERDRFTTIRLAMYNVDICHVVTQRLLSQPISNEQLIVGTVVTSEPCVSVLL